MSEKPTISAILIAKDEQHNIAECLETLAFCDEIVLVDSGSSDETAEIAESLGAKVHRAADWQGFGIQKQRALDLATCDWVLSIDADERVSAALRREIEAAIRVPGPSAYLINRLSWFLGRPMRHGGWYPDRVLRLARRDKARFTPAAVHEEMLADGKVRRLEETLTHYSYRSIDDVLGKMRLYARCSADERRRKGASGGLATALGRGLFAFVKVYIFQAGFLDGGRGLVAAIYRAQETFWRYLAVGWDRPS